MCLQRIVRKIGPKSGLLKVFIYPGKVDLACMHLQQCLTSFSVFHTFMSGSLHLLAAEQLQQRTKRSTALLKGTYAGFFIQILHPSLKPQCFSDLWTAFFSKLQRLNGETSCGKCVRVWWWLCGGNWRWSGGQTEKESEAKEGNLLFHSKISNLRAKEEGVDRMPVSKDGRNANSWLPQGEHDLSEPAKSIDTEKRADSRLCWWRLHAIFPVRTDGGSPLKRTYWEACAVLTQEGHNSTCHRASINMWKYLNRFPLITPLLTSGCDIASGPTTSGSCWNNRRCNSSRSASKFALDGIIRRTTWHGWQCSPALLPPPRQTYFYPVRLMLKPKTLAEVSYAEDRQSAATK